MAGATTFPPRWEACHWILSRLWLPANRVTRFPVEKSGAAGKGEASAANQSAECLLCHMTLKANPVTLTSYSLPPKGETTHYILRVAIAPSSTAVTDSLDFQVADAPLQIQFA